MIVLESLIRRVTMYYFSNGASLHKHSLSRMIFTVVICIFLKLAIGCKCSCGHEQTYTLHPVTMCSSKYGIVFSSGDIQCSVACYCVTYVEFMENTFAWEN